jgi:hypothetical protein
MLEVVLAALTMPQRRHERDTFVLSIEKVIITFARRQQ